MTVSNVYNQPDKVSAEVLRRVLDTADALGYPGPDPMARSLRRGRVGAVGVVFGESLAYAFDDPGAMQLLQGVAHACADDGAGLYLIPTTGAASDETLVLTAAVDALILFGLADDHPLVAASLRRHLPLVTSGGPKLPGHAFVGIDERAAAAAAAGHVIEFGHRAIAVVTLPLGTLRRGGRADLSRQRSATFRVAKERLNGYRRACEAAAIDWADVDVFEAPTNSCAAALDVVAELLNQAPATTAVLAMSDELALGAIEAAAEIGRRIPNDLSIVGWDDTPNAVASRPHLTTIRQTLRTQGQLLGTLAVSDHAGRRSRQIPWDLVVRETTGAAPNRSRGSTSEGRRPIGIERSPHRVDQGL